MSQETHGQASRRARSPGQVLSTQSCEARALPLPGSAGLSASAPVALFQVGLAPGSPTAPGPESLGELASLPRPSAPH